MKHAENIVKILDEETDKLRKQKSREDEDLKRLKLLAEIAKLLPKTDPDPEPDKKATVTHLTDEDLERLASE